MKFTSSKSLHQIGGEFLLSQNPQRAPLLETKTARLAISSSKNKEPWVLPLAGQLWDVIERRVEQRRLDSPLFSTTATESRSVTLGKSGIRHVKPLDWWGVIPHDLRRCAARNLSLPGVREQLTMKITGHKTNSMYRRYRIVDEDELRQAQEQQQAFLKNQTGARKVVPLRTGT
jgi:integrase